MKTSTGLVVALLVCALAGIGAVGCNTFRGAGRDIQRGGRAVQHAADDAQHQQRHQHTITASAGPGGWITPSGTISAHYRSSQTFTIKADRGYRVADVLVDGRSVGPRSRYTFDHVTENHTISAGFDRHHGR